MAVQALRELLSVGVQVDAKDGREEPKAQPGRGCVRDVGHWTVDLTMRLNLLARLKQFAGSQLGVGTTRPDPNQQSKAEQHGKWAQT